MSLHEQPATQADEDTKNVRNDEYGHDPLVAMPSILQQDPGNHTIKPGRRERVADPARELICCQRAVEAARSGHLFFIVGGPAPCGAPAALIRHSALHAKWCSGAAASRALKLWQRISGIPLTPPDAALAIYAL